MGKQLPAEYNPTSMHHFEHMDEVLRKKSAIGRDGGGKLLYCGALKCT